MKAMAGRADQSLPVGNEGAGTVVKAGASPAAQALLGKTVAIIGGAMYAQYRCIAANQCLLLPPDATAADGASCFVNPLTALGMVETMKREGHSALVHTAAASNLGQMLNRICLKDGIALVNIVRKPEQAALLREQGAKHVCITCVAQLHGRADRCAGGHRRHHRLRRHRRRQAGRADPHVHGSGDQPQRQGVQPLRLGGAQAGLPVRHARHDPDRVQPQLRHGLGHGRLAAVSLPAEDRPGRGAEAARACRRGAEDHLRQPLHAHGVAGRGADARRRSRCTHSARPAPSSSSTRAWGWPDRRRARPRRRDHSTSSSTSASTEGGRLRPSACAVLRFSDSRKRLGCSIGMPAGSSPCSTRPSICPARRNSMPRSGP